MTVRVERSFELAARPEAVWSFIADPERRARAISVVEDFESTGDRTATWHVRVPIPVVRRTVAIDTTETRLDPPSFVRFVGRSKVLHVVGEHELDEMDDGGTRLTLRFTVTGKLPGVERFFRRQLDGELENVAAAIRADLGLSS